MWPNDDNDITPDPSGRITRIRIDVGDITEFLNHLHTQSADYLEQALKQKETEGFVEANELINHIKGLK